jgi:lysozyme family protein
MSKFEFDRAMEFVIEWEGGFVDHPEDPGGATNFGISSRAHNLTYEQVKSLTLEQAKEIYYREYWLKAKCDTLKWPMNLILFDTAVNVGVNRAVSWLSDFKTPGRYLARRLRHYTSLKTFRTFGAGWANRTAALTAMLDSESETKVSPFELVQVFHSGKSLDFYPIAQTIGATRGGRPKLMIRIGDMTLLEKLKALFL